jgi:hypothetical protein
MLTIPHSVIRDCLAVFRRALPRPFLAKAATPIHILGERECTRLRLLQPDVAVEYFHPSPSRCESLIIPIAAIADCEGPGNGAVQLQRREGGKVELRWEQNGDSYQREYVSPKTLEQPFPAWSARDSANDPSLLAALDEAMQIPTGNSGRLSLTCIQLRGKQGDVVATDGRQLLVQGGFQFPWKDALLMARTPIFAARELPRDELVRVAQTKTHVCFRIGGWTIALTIDSSARYPNVDAVIPKADQVKTRWRVGDDEAPALVKMLDSLPAAKEDQAPVTLDLARPVVIRARGENEKRCTDVALPQSNIEGKTLRMVVNRHFLQKALELGFRSVLVTAPDKPLLCQDGKRLYVWVPLDPANALAPQSNAIRVMLPALVDKSRRSMAAPEPAKRQMPAAPVPPSPSRNRAFVFDGFLSVARSLWGLVRKQRQKEDAK